MRSPKKIVDDGLAIGLPLGACLAAAVSSVIKLNTRVGQRAVDAIPDGVAKLDGEWVRLVSVNVEDDDGETLTCWAVGG